MKTLLKTALAIFAVVMIASTAEAETGTFNANSIGCISEDALDEWGVASGNNDKRHAETLMGRVCFWVSGREYTVIERGFMSWKVKVRVYFEGDSAVVWTPSGHLK